MKKTLTIMAIAGLTILTVSSCSRILPTNDDNENYRNSFDWSWTLRHGSGSMRN